MKKTGKPIASEVKYPIPVEVIYDRSTPGPWAMLPDPVPYSTQKPEPLPDEGMNPKNSEEPHA